VAERTVRFICQRHGFIALTASSSGKEELNDTQRRFEVDTIPMETEHSLHETSGGGAQGVVFVWDQTTTLGNRTNPATSSFVIKPIKERERPLNLPSLF